MTNPEAPSRETYWVVPGKFLAGPHPGTWSPTASQAKIQRLLDAGITVFIDLTQANDRNVYQQWLTDDTRYQRMPIPDFGIPNPALMHEILDTIDTAIAQGEGVYVHCHAGLGRTGTVVGCYLARHGITGEAALQELQRLRQDSLFAAHESPETHAQRQMVKSWRSRE